MFQTSKSPGTNGTNMRSGFVSSNLLGFLGIGCLGIGGIMSSSIEPLDMVDSGEFTETDGCIFIL